jgi:dienelactone hydrolase
MIANGAFAWFHSRADRQSGGFAVVICPGIGRDSSTGYRPTRFLADTLAEAGYPALRVGYPGTGDSSDIAADACWAAWRQSLDTAIDRALRASGAERVVLVGIRLGGMLAALAASEREEVAGLALLEPVLRGSSYVLQLKLEEKIARGETAPDQDVIQLHGLSLSPASLNAMAGIDLRSRAPRPGCQVLFLTDASSAVSRACMVAWNAAGAEVVHETPAGLAAFFRPTHLCDEPPPDLGGLMRWLGHALPRRGAARPMPSAAGPLSLTHPGCVETPHFFGEDRHLFGMLCRPDRPEPRGTIVIIGNSGGDPHDGFARFGVELARSLGRQGIASLRMDFAGLGDSLNAADDRDGVTHSFDVDRRQDFAAAIDLVQEMGFRTIALHGLCSGAFHAFQAAAADSRVTSVLCVNLPWFTLRYEKAGPGSFARRTMQGFGERNVRSLFLFATGDAGLKPLQIHFGPSGRDLAALPGCDLAILPELDHDLTRPEMRRLVIDRIVKFLRDGIWVEETATRAQVSSLDAGLGDRTILQPLHP